MANGLYIQIDMLDSLARVEQDELNEDLADGLGLNPAWTHTAIRRNFAGRPLEDRPLIRLALHALHQAVGDLLAGPESPCFGEAIAWLNETECLLSIDRVCAELDTPERVIRAQIAEYIPELLVACGPLQILKSRVPYASSLEELEPVIKPVSRRARQEDASDAAAAAARSVADRSSDFSKAVTSPLHAAFGRVVASRRKRERIDLAALAVKARQEARKARQVVPETASP